MKKIWKNGLALFLAGIMTLTTVGEAAAATLSTSDSNVIVV